ncbi:MAG TPA: hypothetical protein PLN61_04465 [bacterium]|nr:hypothetical protein [bacterium]HQI47897.1 hypothetical protein [bacterium]HQJ66339.1 hypothetical protein [bacterium]
MYISNGHEPIGFEVSSPDKLFGRHKALVTSLLENSVPQATIYCPIYDGGDSLFGHRNPKASCAVCLTNTLLIVSIDHHRRNSFNSFALPHSRIICLETGSALLQGWFRLVFKDDNEEFNKIDILCNARVLEYFDKLVRIWRKMVKIRPKMPPGVQALEGTFDYTPLLLPREKVLTSIVLPAQFTKNHKKEILSHATKLLLTTYGLVVLITESSPFINQINFGERRIFWNLRPMGSPIYFGVDATSLTIRIKDHPGFDLLIYQTAGALTQTLIDDLTILEKLSATIGK